MSKIKWHLGQLDALRELAMLGVLASSVFCRFIPPNTPPDFVHLASKWLRLQGTAAFNCSSASVPSRFS